MTRCEDVLFPVFYTLKIICCTFLGYLLNILYLLFTFYFPKKSLICRAIHLFNITLNIFEFFTALYPGSFRKEEEKGNHQSGYNTMILRSVIDSNYISELAAKTVNNVLIPSYMK